MTTHLYDIFLGRQPILDRNQHIVAYELLFRDSLENAAKIDDDMEASIHVIVRAFGGDLHNVLGDKKGFINTNAELLLSDVIEQLPQDRVVLEILETVEINDALVARCRELKQKGFCIALDDFNGNARFEPLYPYIDIVKFDLTQIPADQLAKHVQQMQPWDLTMLAEKVEQIEQAEQCNRLGFQLFQGYYFARPVILSGKRADTSRISLLKLIELILSDAHPEQLEQIFKRDPNLSFSLLRMINSAAMGVPYRISSIKQAIVTLGYRQLQRWLQLLLFVNNNEDLDNPLFELAATRGKLMEQLVAIIAPNDKALMDRAFMVGIMSLLDSLFGTTMEEILRQVHLAEDVEAAVLKRTGTLGMLLMLILHVEQNNQSSAKQLVQELALNELDLMRCQLDSICWANAIRQDADN